MLKYLGVIFSDTPDGNVIFIVKLIKEREILDQFSATK
jgi:hypothetical protein